MSELTTLTDTKLTLKFEDQNYYNSDIKNSATDQAIYNFAVIINKYQVTEPAAIFRTEKYEFNLS